MESDQTRSLGSRYEFVCNVSCVVPYHSPRLSSRSSEVADCGTGHTSATPAPGLLHGSNLAVVDGVHGIRQQLNFPIGVALQLLVVQGSLVGERQFREGAYCILLFLAPLLDLREGFFG